MHVTAAQQRLDELLGKLARLRLLDPEMQQDGALVHQYELTPPLSEEEARAFERERGVSLPAEYRLFLTRAGNGGAGPEVGVTPLAAWCPELMLPEKYVEFDGDKPVMVDGRPLIVDVGPRPEIDRLADPSRPFMLEAAWPTKQVDALPGEDVHPLDGCTLLAEIGGGYHAFLVISGTKAGEVWEDYTHGQVYEAICPTGLTFFSWYERWLERAIAACELSP